MTHAMRTHATMTKMMKTAMLTWLSSHPMLVFFVFPLKRYTLKILLMVWPINHSGIDQVLSREHAGNGGEMMNRMIKKDGPLLLNVWSLDVWEGTVEEEANTREGDKGFEIVGITTKVAVVAAG